MAVRGEKVYAIGFGQWVELRSCKKPPRPVVTAFEKETEVVAIHYEVTPNGRFKSHRTKIPRKIRINNTIYTGGKVLGTISTRDFWNVVPNVLPKGHAVALTKTQAVKLLAIVRRSHV